MIHFFLQYYFITFWRMIISKPLYPLLYNNVFAVHISFYKIPPMPYGGTFAVLIFNCSPLDGTISRQVLKPGALKFFLALPDLPYDLQLGPVPTPISKNGSFHAHVLETPRALELVSHRHVRWDSNIHSPQSCYYQILHSRVMLFGQHGVPTSSSQFLTSG